MSFLESPFGPMTTFDSQTTLSSISSLDPKLSRTNYYDGRLLKASDLTRDQFYLDERLREVGRALGQGIVRGLNLTLNATNRKLTVSPGIAVTPSGRVLELEKTSLEINITDDATIHELNPGYRSLQAGLYAVLVRYAEKGIGSAEIYPRDLEADRGLQFNAYSEGMEFALVKLLNLPQQQFKNSSAEDVSVYIRAELVKNLLLSNPAQPDGIGEDSIALGLLAVEYGIPQWLDSGLLRRPFRSAQSLNYLQADLYNHYEELFKDITQGRRLSATKDSFLASQYFSIIPPIGSIPKGAVDPVNGYQNYFPQAYEVSISPVRQDDVPSLIQQSLALEPIDLRADADVDIMIAVVLDDMNFSYVARKLQHLDKEGNEFIAPSHLDEFFLSPLSNIQTSDVWKTIWDSAKQIFYVRRPIRVAETQVSAVVLASGNYEELEKVKLPKFSVEDLEQEIDQLSENNNQLHDQITQLNTNIQSLTLELNKPNDVRLQEVTTKLQVATVELQDAAEKLKTVEEKLTASVEDKDKAVEAAIKQANEQIKALQSELEKALAEIEQLKQDATNDNGTTDNTDLDQLKKQLDATQKQLIQLQELVAGIFEKQELKLENLSLMEKLRTPNDAESQTVMKKTVEMAADKTEFQSQILQLLTLMPPVYDSVNWPTIAFVVEKQLFEKLRESLLSSLKESFPVLMVKVSKDLGFPDEILQSWEKVSKAPLQFVPRLADIDNIKILKVNQLLPASLSVSDEDRKILKTQITADSNLLKPLSQLKALVDPIYETPLWSSLPVIIENQKLDDFVDFVIQVNEKSLPLGISIASTNTRFKLTVALRNAWADVDLG